MIQKKKKWEKEIKIGVNLLKIMGIDQSTFINTVHLSDVQQKEYQFMAFQLLYNLIISVNLLMIDLFESNFKYQDAKSNKQNLTLILYG